MDTRHTRFYVRQRAAGSRGPGLAPDPATTDEPVVQVYGARCEGVRGLFGMHTWTAVKPQGASKFTIYEVIGWRARVRGPVLAVWRGSPDVPWSGHAPELLADKRGDGVDALISRIAKAAHDYPYAGEYVVWPGPNSNTFTSHIARAVPELELDLPPTAIGKDYLGGRLVGATPSGRGAQVSLFGLFGALASRVEGFEVNVLSLSFGIDPFSPALRLPLLGRIGAARRGGRAFSSVWGPAARPEAVSTGSDASGAARCRSARPETPNCVTLVHTDDARPRAAIPERG